jgi:hypothetical protein
MVYLIPAIFEVSADDVKYQRRHGMSHMSIVVDGDTADIHFDITGLKRLEIFFFAGEGIVDAKHILLLTISADIIINHCLAKGAALMDRALKKTK